ncbi:CBS domain-containing protein [Actinosynnema pretiosum subsp. pretiosum]
MVSVEPGTTVRTATALLVDHGFSALPVSDADGRLVGIVSGSDLLLAGLGRTTGDLEVRQVMRAPVISAPLTASATDLAGTMLGNHLRCLPVVDHVGTLVGVVSRSDLLRVLTPDDDVLAARIDRALRAYDPAGHWHVAVEAGRAVVRGAIDDEAERRAVTALVRTVPGTTTVDVSIATPR